MGSRTVSYFPCQTFWVVFVVKAREETNDICSGVPLRHSVCERQQEVAAESDFHLTTGQVMMGPQAEGPSGFILLKITQGGIYQTAKKHNDYKKDKTWPCNFNRRKLYHKKPKNTALRHKMTSKTQQ